MTQPLPSGTTDADKAAGMSAGAGLKSGVFPDRDYTSAPDIEQKKRLQARQETDKAMGRRATHPSYVKTLYGTSPGVVAANPKTKLSRAEAKAAKHEL